MTAPVVFVYVVYTYTSVRLCGACVVGGGGTACVADGIYGAESDTTARSRTPHKPAAAAATEAGV